MDETKLGWKVLETIPIDIPSGPAVLALTIQQVQDMLTCFSHEVNLEEIGIPEIVLSKTGLNLMYSLPIELVTILYEQFKLVRRIIIDIIVGNYHRGEFIDNRDGNWVWGTKPKSAQELKDILFFIIRRDFNEAGQWLYTISQGNFDALRPILDRIVDLFLANNDHGDAVAIFAQVNVEFPWTQPV